MLEGRQVGFRGIGESFLNFYSSVTQPYHDFSQAL